MPAAGRSHDTDAMESHRIVVAIANPALARVLLLRLRESLPGEVVVSSEGGFRRGDVVLATPSDFDAVAAAELMNTGVQPIILTPIPRQEEAARYSRAGAPYLAMSIDNHGTLEHAVICALERQSLPAMALRAAASQAVSPRSSA